MAVWPSALSDDDVIAVLHAPWRNGGPDGDAERATAIAADVVARLAALTPRARLELAERLKLPVSARVLGAQAGPLLRLCIEDEALRPFFADGAAHLWLELDIGDALPAALGVAQDVNGMTLLSLAGNVDGDERFELLSARLASDDFFVELLSRTGAQLIAGDDRYIDVVQRAGGVATPAGVRLIRRVATARAIDELAGVVVRAHAIDDVTLEALDGLSELHASAEVVIDVLRAPIARAIAATNNTWRIAGLVERRRSEVLTAVPASEAEVLLAPFPPARDASNTVIG